MSGPRTITATTRPMPKVLRRIKSHARRHDHRGGERPRDGRRPEDHGEHDQPGRRQPGLPDLVRLLRSAHAEDVREVSRRAVPPLRRHVERGEAPEERRLLFRLYRHGPVPQRHRRRPYLEVQEAGLHRRQADPAGADQHQQLHAGRPHASIPPSPPRSSSPATGRCRSRRPRPPTAWSTRASTSSPATSTARRW